MECIRSDAVANQIQSISGPNLLPRFFDNPSVELSLVNTVMVHFLAGSGDGLAWLGAWMLRGKGNGAFKLPSILLLLFSLHRLHAAYRTTRDRHIVVRLADLSSRKSLYRSTIRTSNLQYHAMNQIYSCALVEDTTYVHLSLTVA